MKCASIETRAVEIYDPDTRKSHPGTNEVVRLTAVTGDENKPWSQYTPQATVELFITNPKAVEQFVVGEAYFVDFTPAPAEG
jgi:hypothetical protein